jgi:hypothetical protein
MKYFLKISVLVLFISILSCEKKTSCTDFKSGTFLISTDTSFVKSQKIIRNNDLDIQVSPKGDSVFAKIEWLNDCSYKLKFDKNRMHLSNFHLNINTNNGILVEYGQAVNGIMPFVSVIKGKTKTETFNGFIKKVK